MSKTPEQTIIDTSVDPSLSYLQPSQVGQIVSSENGIITTRTDKGVVYNTVENVTRVISKVVETNVNADWNATEGSGLIKNKPNLGVYATQTQVNQSIGSAIGNLINGAPTALDTLSEIANSLGNNSSLASTITNQLANKANTSYVDELYNTISLNDIGNMHFDNTTMSPVSNVSNITLQVGGDQNFVFDTNGDLSIPGMLVTTGVGTPRFSSATDFIIDAQNRVKIENGAFKLASKTNAERALMLAQAGDMIYNTTSNEVQVYRNGAWSSVGSGGSASTGNFTFTDNTITTDDGTQDIVLSIQGYNATQPTPEFVDFSWTFDARGGLTLPSSLFFEHAYFTAENSEQIFAGNTNKDFRLRTMNNSVPGINDWIFDIDGTLTVPGTITKGDNLTLNSLGATSGNVAAVVADGDAGRVFVRTDNGTATKSWEFDINGNLKLPAGGDILNSSGQSVLGGSGIDLSNVVHITNTSFSSLSTNGALIVDGGVGIGGNLNADGVTHVFNGNLHVTGPDSHSFFLGVDADVQSLTAPLLIAKDSYSTYVQAGLINSSQFGSADWVAYGDQGDDQSGWTDMGYTSSNFNDPNYTVTGKGDGYLFVKGLDYNDHQIDNQGGNLILATGSTGTTNDIVFATGGFLTQNIFARISHANNSFELSHTGASIKFPDGSVQTTAYTGQSVGSDTGNITFSDTTLTSSNGNVKIHFTPSASPAVEFNFTETGEFILPNGGTQRSVGIVSCPPNVDTVIYTSIEQYTHTLKLLLCIEGYEGSNTGNDFDTQSCEMIVAKSHRNNTVSGSAYGLVYTSASPLVTLSTRWDVATSRIEVICRPASLTNSVSVRITGTELRTTQL